MESNYWKWNPMFWTPIVLIILCSIVGVTALMSDDIQMRVVGIYLGISILLNVMLTAAPHKYGVDSAKQQLYHAILSWHESPESDGNSKHFSGIDTDKDIKDAIENLILTARKLK
jgi:hypothetical protein